MRIFKAGRYNLDFGQKTLIMGILNLTPDSFSDGNVWNTVDKAVNRALEIENLGADILDIGGQSTRPGFTKISAEEEWNRIYPVLKELEKKINIPISIDTFYPEVAYKALSLGVSIINDISGFSDKNMFEVVSKSDCGIVVVHSLHDMKIKSFFESTIDKLNRYQVNTDRVCLDPGIGFKESRKQDRFIINNLNSFKVDKLPMLIGTSRKRVISEHYKNVDNDILLQGNIVANTLSIVNGANILRVHDIKETILSVRLAEKIFKEQNENDI